MWRLKGQGGREKYLRDKLILQQRSRLRAVRQTVGAAGAFAVDHFVHVVDVLHFRMDRSFGADFAAQAAGDAEIFNDSDFHGNFNLSRVNSLQLAA